MYPLRTVSTSSLSNKGARELKKEFEIIVKEIEIELRNLVDAMKEENGSCCSESWNRMS